MKKGTASWLSWILLLFLSLPANGQGNGNFGIGLHAGVSHSGWNLSVVGQYQKNNFQAYLGPSVSLTRGLPGKGPIGINAGADYILRSRLDWLSTVINFDYQGNFFSSDGHTDVTDEFHLSYGLMIKPTDRLYFIQQLGYGFFLESFYDEFAGKRRTNSGYSGLVKMRAGYLF